MADLENARSREMTHHGELVRTLEQDVAFHKGITAELQLQVAKCRAGQARMDADQAVAQQTITQLQTELQRQQQAGEQVRIERDLERQVAERRIAELLVQNDDFAKSTRELLAQTIEVTRLNATIAEQVKEVDRNAMRIQFLTDENNRLRASVTSHRAQIDNLEDELAHVCQTRNRLLHWKCRWIDKQRAQILRRSTLLAWKSVMMARQVAKTNDLATRLATKSEQLLANELALGRMSTNVKALLDSLRLHNIRFTRLVEANGRCGNQGGKIAMCANRNYMCRMKDSQQMFAREPLCLPMNRKKPDTATRYALDSAAPWTRCDPEKELVNRPLCRFQFTCQCQQRKSGPSCRCMPPDTVKAFVQNPKAKCGVEQAPCDHHLYCRWTNATTNTCSPPAFAVDVAMTQGQGHVHTPTKATSVHKPLFDSPTKNGVHHAIATYTPTERRFNWQNTTNSTDALYKLPTTIGTGPKKGFGTSTREDWDLSKKKGNPCAGPGSYESVSSCGRQPDSVCRSAAVAAFDNAARSPLNSDTTPSPGPIYDLPVTVGTAPGVKFGTAKREPAANDGPGPNIALRGSFREARQGVSPTFGTEKRLRSAASANFPGPIYDVSPTGFKTGATFSFSNAKRF
ncbi:TPA: hypothetical protein N0F65_008535 [Lagenidium giganteum]|uniref:Protein of centriole 5 n=1 Tax=Lagenidium giganteum TaxID=4803 RepID=A0AAV2YPV7_9STRA|nr:TPA: hypothetical protein N0F65_008535 [Lagenidium giganteum]